MEQRGEGGFPKPGLAPPQAGKCGEVGGRGWLLGVYGLHGCPLLPETNPTPKGAKVSKRRGCSHFLSSLDPWNQQLGMFSS